MERKSQPSGEEGLRGHLPRTLSPSLLWAGGCLAVPYAGRIVHGHLSCFLIVGSDATMLVDTGYPFHWTELEKDVDRFLEGRPLDYIFVSHPEYPHAGLLPDWMRKYPQAIAVGDMSDYPLYYPELTDRMRNVAPGDAIDLGDRRILFLPPVWKDLESTLWAFDDKDRILFVCDGCAYLHYHDAGDCDRTMSEAPLPDLHMIRFYNERALYWTRFTDPAQGDEDMDVLMRAISPAMLAQSHGGVVDNIDEVLPLMKQSMNVYKPSDAVVTKAEASAQV